MAKVAIVIYAGVETEADRGRLFNALEAAGTLEQSVTDEVRLVFDGAAAEWVERLEDPEHEFHELYNGVSSIAVCRNCAQNYGLEAEIKASQAELLRSREEGTSIVSLLRSNYEVVTF